MERLLFKNVTDGVPAYLLCLEEKDGVDRWTSTLQTLSSWGLLCVLFDSLFSCWGDISPFCCDTAQQCRSLAVDVFIRLHPVFFFYFLTAELKVVSQLLALSSFQCFSTTYLTTSNSVLSELWKTWHRVVSEALHFIRGERKEAQWSHGYCCFSEIKNYHSHIIKIMHTDVSEEEKV